MPRMGSDTMEAGGLMEDGMWRRDAVRARERATTILFLFSPFSCPSTTHFSPFQHKRESRLHSWDGKDPFFLTLEEILEFLEYPGTSFY